MSLNSAIRQVTDYLQHLNSKRMQWRRYGRNTGSASQWSRHMTTLSRQFSPASTQASRFGCESEVNSIKRWFRNAISEWARTGQGDNGNNFSNWLSGCQKLVRNLQKKLEEKVAQIARNERQKELMRKRQQEQKARDNYFNSSKKESNSYRHQNNNESNDSQEDLEDDNDYEEDDQNQNDYN